MLDALHGDDGRRGVVLGFAPGRPARTMAGSSRRRRPIAKMVEYKDATEEERAVELCNSGLMAVRVGGSVSAARRRSATTMPRANITCPTSS